MNLLLELADKYQPAKATCLYTAARLLENVGRFTESLEYYLVASKVEQTEHKYFEAAVQLALNMGKTVIAMNLIDSRITWAQADKTVPNDELALYYGLSGLARWYDNKYDVAEADFNKGLTLVAERSSAVNALLLNDSITIYNSRADYSEVEKRLRKAAAIYVCISGRNDHRLFIVNLNLVAALTKQGKYQQAASTIKQLESAINRVDAENLTFHKAQLYINKANLLAEQGDLAAAEHQGVMAREVLEDVNATMTFLYTRVTTYLGNIYLLQGKSNQAIEALKTSIGAKSLLYAMTPNPHMHREQFDSYVFLAEACSTKGDDSEAKHYLGLANQVLGASSASPAQKAARLLEAEGKVAENAGQVKHAIDKLSSAARLYQTAITVKPSKIATLFAHIAHLQREVGEVASAEQNDANSKSWSAKQTAINVPLPSPPIDAAGACIANQTSTNSARSGDTR